MKTRHVSFLLAPALAALLAAGSTTAGAATPPVAFSLEPLGAYGAGVAGGAEIVAYDHETARMFVTNGANVAIDIVDIADPSVPILVESVDLTPYGASVQSVATSRGRVAAAVAAADPTAPGSVVVFDTAGEVQAVYPVGVLPDMVTFTPNGRYLLSANEAEPVCDGNVLLADPPGSVSVIHLNSGVVRTAGFDAYIGREEELRAEGIRIFFPGSNASQDLEPESIATSGNSRTAYVTLQENNAVATVDLNSATVTDLVALGYKDHALAGNGLDPSNRDGGINIAPHDVLGMYQPDSAVVARLGSAEYLVTANEGDARDYDCFSEEIRVGDVGLGAAYDAGDDDNAVLGRLRTTDAFPTTFDTDGRIEQVYAYGARSFSIWTTDGQQVFDSGDEFEQRTAALVPEIFNADESDPDEFDDRSDDKGPEPEALAVARLKGRTYAFIGLERTGGIFAYDITDPEAPSFVDYVNTASELGDVGPEAITVVGPASSPTGTPLLLVAFEVSGTTRVFEITG